jgi:hypothetical protein
MNMKRLIINKHINWLAARIHYLPLYLLLLTLFSCSKDKQLDMDILKAKITNSISYVLGGNVVTLNNTNYNFTNVHIGVAIALTEQTKSADTITAVVDPSLVADYNNEHQETNFALPDGSFGVTHDGVFPVAASASAATDSLYVLLKDGSSLKNGSVYLVPVRLTAKNGSKLKFSTYYFKIRVTIGALKVIMDGVTVYKGSKVTRIVNGGALNATYTSSFPDSLKFSVKINSLFPAHDVVVEGAALTVTQTDSLNKAKNFGALSFPVDTYTISQPLAHVGTKSQISTDSIVVRFKNKTLFKSLNWYLFSIKLKHYKGTEYGVPPVLTNDSSSVYIRVFVF